MTWGLVFAVAVSGYAIWLLKMRGEREEAVMAVVLGFLTLLVTIAFLAPSRD
ncbi:hypothetical protein [Zavarzinia sp. CC-PAN008]|uniref:hypothetical protein n=1 Tax=Zavarzinia sp. CC-PAN008 TaxID=3243332 RepID=UPI003F742A46